MEGEISKRSINDGLHRGKRASGDLVPWTVAQQFQDDDFPSLSGVRIVRIATHPDYQGVSLWELNSIHVNHIRVCFSVYLTCAHFLIDGLRFQGYGASAKVL